MKREEDGEIEYFVYARKSTESEDRQVQSIEDQLTRLRELAANLGLSIRATFTEARSAKSPGQRAVFDMMLRRIEQGEAAGILCWQINRLSRNPIDSGHLAWLLQRGVLRSIRTIERQYLPDDNVLLLSVETGMANQYILDLSRNVRRGIQGKLERGELPRAAPTGYLNDVVRHVIIPDPERFGILRRAWELLLTGNQSVADVRRKLQQWGFKALRRRHTGGRSLSRSTLYKIFSNPFYAGVIRYNGRDYPGKHEAMVTLAEFHNAQKLLGRMGRSAPRKHFFPFSRLIRCGECGCSVTAEKKTKWINGLSARKAFTYYHCTRKRTDYACSQRTYTREDALVRMIEAEVAQYTISSDFYAFALRCLEENQRERSADKRQQERRIRNEIDQVESEMSNLTRLRYRELISDLEFKKERTLLANQLSQLTVNLNSSTQPRSNWPQVARDAFKFMHDLRNELDTSSDLRKRAIVARLGQNHTLMDGRLRIHGHDWFEVVRENAVSVLASKPRSEPGRDLANTMQKGAAAPLSLLWLGIVDTVCNRIKESEQAQERGFLSKLAA